MNILSVVEAANLNAVGRVVLNFYVTARQLFVSDSDGATLEGSIATFNRESHHEEDSNEFVRATRAADIPVDVIPERRRFDLSVIPALKTIVSRREPDIIITHSVKSHFLIWRSRLWKQYPWVAFHHGYTTTDRKMLLYNRFDRWSLPKAGLVVTVCEAFARELSRVARVSSERIRVQHNSIWPAPPPADEDVRALRARLRLDANERIILSVGRLSQEKAHGDLIAAFKQIGDANPNLNCRLLIVGDGPERGPLQAAARALRRGDRIIFAGQVHDVQPYYALADVFVLPSHSEGSPNVLLEAMAANVPVVATAVGGVPEIVANEKSALLVPAKNPKALADAIARLLADSELRQRLTESAASLVFKNHSPEQYVRSLITICREAARETRS